MDVFKPKGSGVPIDRATGGVPDRLSQADQRALDAFIAKETTKKLAERNLEVKRKLEEDIKGWRDSFDEEAAQKNILSISEFNKFAPLYTDYKKRGIPLSDRDQMILKNLGNEFFARIDPFRIISIVHSKETMDVYMLLPPVQARFAIPKKLTREQEQVIAARQLPGYDTRDRRGIENESKFLNLLTEYQDANITPLLRLNIIRRVLNKQVQIILEEGLPFKQAIEKAVTLVFSSSNDAHGVDSVATGVFVTDGDIAYDPDDN